MEKRPPAAPSSTPPEARVAPSVTRLKRATAFCPGLALVSGLTCLATLLGQLIPVVGAPVFAVVGGIGIALRRPLTERERPGTSFAAKTVLKASIVVLGTGLSFREVLTIGGSSLPVLLGTLAVALLGAVVFGRALGVARDLRTLIGVGTGICGASAIAATDAVISATDADVSYAIATIFTFNVAAVLTFPTIGHTLGLSPRGFGLWAGTAVNDLSSVVASSAIFGHGAAIYAVVVKLTRTLMIIPIALGLSGWRTHQLRRTSRRGPARSDNGTSPRRTAVHCMVPRSCGSEYDRPSAEWLAPDSVGDRRGHDHHGTRRHWPLNTTTRHPPCRLPAPCPRRHLVGPGRCDQPGSSSAAHQACVTSRVTLSFGSSLCMKAVSAQNLS